jgi:hypothetical protein
MPLAYLASFSESATADKVMRNDKLLDDDAVAPQPLRRADGFDTCERILG